MNDDQFPNTASGLLGSVPRLMPVGVAIIAVSMVAFWNLSAEHDDWAIYVVLAVGACIGLVLGFRHSRAGHDTALRSAFGVGWRIGAIWILVAGVVEYVVTDQTATFTVLKFPEVFLPLAAIVAIAFYVSHYVVAWARRLHRVSLSDRALNVVLGLTGIVIATAFGIAGLLTDQTFEKGGKETHEVPQSQAE